MRYPCRHRNPPPERGRTMRSSIDTLINDNDLDVQGEVSPADQARITAAFARIPAIQAAADKARGPRFLTPEQAVEASRVAAIHEAARAAAHRDAIFAASAKSIADANAQERVDEGTGENVDKTLQHAKLDADKAAKKDESDDPLQRILAALGDLSARMDSLERSRGDAGKRKDGDGEREEGEGGGEDKEKEKARQLVADAKADDDETQITQFRIRADEVLGTFGQASPRALIGEGYRNYAMRVIRGLQAHSERFKGIGLDGLPPSAFAAITSGILDDAETVGRTGSDLMGGSVIVERKRRDPSSNRMISEFYGPHTFVREMSRPPRFVKSFNVPGQNTGGGA
jgi:hypothetical protein